MTPMEFLLLVLATWRVARMLALEEGPFGVFAETRKLSSPDTWWGRGFRCPLCAGFWVALLLTGVTLTLGPILVFWWGVAGGAAIIQLYLDREVTIEL